MKTSIIRERLHQFIETAEDRKVKAIYTLFEDDIARDEWEFTSEFKEELDKRYAKYKKEGKTISARSANAQIGEILKNRPGK
jgi:hypothetical protein